MDLEKMKKRIEIAGGRRKADLLLKNLKLVDVGSGKIRPAEIAISDGEIAATGLGYEGLEEIDCQGAFALPGLIDAHIHIESCMVTPEEIARLLVPHGCSTLIADPHEIVNVAGLEGLSYMQRAAKSTPMHIEYMLPSCVPATPFEHAGAVLDSKALKAPLEDAEILGLAEMMNFPGIIYADDETLARVAAARALGKPVDGHAPGVLGKELAAYAAAGILTDHECSSVEEMEARLENGMYVLLRQGSACHDLERLLPAVTEENSRRMLFCSDDRQAKTIFEKGHLNEHLRLAVEAGLSPVTAVRMATLNAAEAYGLKDRGALFPGRRADITLVEDLKDFKAVRVFLDGKEVARNGEYLLPVERVDSSSVRSSCHVKDFSEEKLKLQLESDTVHVIGIRPGGVLSAKEVHKVQRDKDKDFVFNPEEDIVRVSVVERHQETGNVANALLGGYGLKRGAIALSVAHDSHNIIVAGAETSEMAAAVEALIRQEGGVVLVLDGEVLECMPLPVAGLMSEESGEWVAEKLSALHRLAIEKLGVRSEIDPVMTLCFMSLPVIPELKLTDMGLFDVTAFDFIPLEAKEED